MRGGAASAHVRPVLPGMAENNNVLEEDAARALTKLRLLCTKMVQDARDAGVTTEEIKAAYTVMKYNELDDSVNEDKSKCGDSTRVVSAKRWHWHQWAGVGALVALLVAVILCYYGDIVKTHLITSKCLVRNNYIVMEATRPPTKCGRVCSGVGGALELSANISREEFERWAYLSRPLVVRGGAAHWLALDKFSVGFLRSLYDSIEGSYEAVAEDCQFLPFRSEFLDLRTALAMHPARAAARPGTKHWYFGWWH
ncbi:hypothetical protein E2C01_003698 [Portunus trituberculatus]|uniref:Uncharacterized protein n=1 Tax=Portunus trituberculatus TaxID=210409 RepID=A0A5B7CPC3_PORTR|nr:hypothetical protein [Portunus trituberculatus]